MCGSDRNLLVFQHHPAEHAGRFTELFAADGVTPHVVQLDRGDPIPALAEFDGLWVLGGPMQVWEEEAHPWLVPEKAAIREAVIDRRMPFFGLCLGHQLLADALGGAVGPAAEPEVGVLAVDLTPEGEASPLLSGLSGPLTCTQGHGAEVKTPPAGAVVLATSPLCAVQAMQIGTSVLSLQFHMELTPDMVEACLELPEYKADVEAVLGAAGAARFVAQSTEHAAEFEKDAAVIYGNWMTAAFGSHFARGATSG